MNLFITSNLFTFYYCGVQINFTIEHDAPMEIEHILVNGNHLATALQKDMNQIKESGKLNEIIEAALRPNTYKRHYQGTSDLINLYDTKGHLWLNWYVAKHFADFFQNNGHLSKWIENCCQFILTRHTISTSTYRKKEEIKTAKKQLIKLSGEVFPV